MIQISVEGERRSGKTTTALHLYDILKQSGYRVNLDENLKILYKKNLFNSVPDPKQTTLYITEGNGG